MPHPHAPATPSFISQQVTEAKRFYLNLRPKARKEIEVVCGGREKCAADYGIRRVKFPYYAVEFVASGSGQLELGKESHPLQAGVVFSYGPGVPHKIQTSPSDRLLKYFVDFTGSRALRLLEQIGLAPGQVLEVERQDEILNLFDTLIASNQAPDRYSARAARLQLELLLIEIARGARTPADDAQGAAAVFLRCRQYIDTQFRSLKTAEDVAAACGINVSYMTRLFRRFQDESPYRYLRRLQLQWAAGQLQSSACSVKSVARDLRIDPIQFSRSFKTVYGVSPSSFAGSRRP